VVLGVNTLLHSSLLWDLWENLIISDPSRPSPQ
jgi:hypothetical protein